MAALRGGAGLVRLAVPDRLPGNRSPAYEPSYMTVPLADDPAGRIALSALPKIIEHAARRPRSWPSGRAWDARTS